MTKLERIYGISVSIDAKIQNDEYKRNELMVKAIAIAKLKGFNIEEFLVFRHAIIIDARRMKKHFSNRFTVSQRIKTLDITFKVNHKQVNNGSIIFVNLLIDRKFEDEDFHILNSETILKRFISGKEIEERHLVETELFTFIKNAHISDKHKKIMISVLAQPTLLYEKELRNADDFNPTDFQQRLSKDVELKVNKEMIAFVNSEMEAQIEPLYKYNSLTDAKLLDFFKNLQLKIDMSTNLNINNSHIGTIATDNSGTVQTTQNIRESFLQRFDNSLLTDQLAELRTRLDVIKDVNNQEHLAAIEGLKQAEEAIKEGDAGKVVRFLKKAGEWALDVAKSIGVPIAVDALKMSLGYL